MRRSLIGSTLGVMVFAGACASGNTPETGATPQFDQPQALSAAARDSAVAQSIADREGPRVSIHANIYNSSGLRRVRADFYAQDDAYIVVGQIDASGTLRIVFPDQPGDDGFVRGRHSYQTPEFLAGFTDQFRYRYQTTYHNVGQARDSYDGGLGYVFIIASWRPLALDRISSGGEFDSYELADASYMSDPRWAIQELAAELAGDNREAYTLKYARYFDTQTMYTGNSAFASNYGYGYCAGYSPLGFGSSPFDTRYGYSALSRLGQSFFYRGTYYSYDLADDCYRAEPGFFGLNSGFAGFRPPPPSPPVGPRKSAIDAMAHQPPMKPTPRPAHQFPSVIAQDGGTPNTGTGAHVSPEYRRRGLITTDAPSSGPEHRDAHARLAMPGEEGATAGERPNIQQMVNRGDERGYARPGSVDRPRPSIERNEPMTREAPPRVESAPRSAPPPRVESAPRSAPPPHVEPMRSPPPPPAPRAEPASGSSSSSGAGRPIKPAHH